MSRSQFHSIKLFILRHAWLNLWDKHMTTGRINQVTLFCTPKPDNQAAKPHTSAHPENGHAKRPTRANTHTELAPRSTDDDTKTKRSLPLEANKAQAATTSWKRDWKQPTPTHKQQNITLKPQNSWWIYQTEVCRSVQATTLWFFRHFSLPMPSYEASATALKLLQFECDAASWYTQADCKLHNWHPSSTSGADTNWQTCQRVWSYAYPTGTHTNPSTRLCCRRHFRSHYCRSSSRHTESTHNQHAQAADSE